MNLEKWHHHMFSSSTTVGDDFKAFAKDFKKFIKEIAASIDAKLVKCNVGHYFLSGFIEKNKKFVYFSTGDVRVPIVGKWYENILVRKAAHSRDYYGGKNHTVSVKNLKEMIQKLLEE